MADIILLPVAKQILGKLGDLAFEQIGLLWTLNKEITKLGDTVSTIQALLLDAQEKQSHNCQVKDWLEKLSDVMYDADDLLDDFCTEARRQAMDEEADDDGRRTRRSPTTTACWSMVCFLFSSLPKQLIYGLRMAHDIKGIRDKLEYITKDKESLHLEVRSEKAVSVPSRESDSRPPLIVVGRDDDKKNIVELLLNANPEANISVIPIVGMGGLGKTTLAQLVFDDEQVEDHFGIRAWVYVSQTFDVKAILEKMLRSIAPGGQTGLELDVLQGRLREELNGKRFLFALDDVWEENDRSWENLAKYLNAGAPGSKVLVTTRSTKVAEVGCAMLKSRKNTNIVEPYELKGLSLDQSWSLLEERAHPQPLPQDPRVREIGRKILEKCCGVPIAVSTTASILISSQHPETEWLSFLEKRVSSISEEGDATMSLLRLSFDDLSSHMKNCFTYCKLFPKGHELEVRMLVRLWVSQGYIKSYDEGLDCFRKLWWRSFFMQVETDEFGNITTCRMHDLVHDLVDYITGGKILRSSNSALQREITPNTRHLSLFDEKVRKDVTIGGGSDVHTELGNARKARTLICGESISWEECRRMLRNFKRLRVLIVAVVGSQLDSVAELKHLRYLAIECVGTKCLPDSIANLLNLQALLVDSKELEELPRSIRRLVDLKHLSFDGRNVTHMPKGIGELKSLRTLSFFVVGKKSNDKDEKVGGLDELKELNALHGELTITNLVNNAESLSGYVLKSKAHLQSLILDWGRTDGDGDDGGDSTTSHDADIEGFRIERYPTVLVPLLDAELLEMLCPHPNLRKMKVCGGYGGSKLPNWVSGITNLVEFALSDCKTCEYLPPLHRLPCLKKLKIENCPQLEGINDNREGDSRCGFSPTLSENEEVASFQCLASLRINGCPKLTRMPTFPSVEGELTVIRASLIPLAKTMKMKIKRGGMVGPLSKLTRLKLSEIHEDFRYLSRDDGFNNFSSLEFLSVDDCSIGVKLPSSLCLSMSLTGISIRGSYMVEWMPPLHELPCLRELGLNYCSNLKGCWWSEEDEEQWPHFPCLSRLQIDDCPNLTRFPLFPTVEGELSLSRTSSEALVRTMRMEVGGTVLVDPPLSKLTRLILVLIDDLESLPEQGLRNLTSLEAMYINICQELASLPPAMRHLTSLQTLGISWCPELVERCRKGEGEDWPNISHIPNIQLEGQVIQGEDD